jgi:hypothetical protein
MLDMSDPMKVRPRHQNFNWKTLCPTEYLNVKDMMEPSDPHNSAKMSLLSTFKFLYVSRIGDPCLASVFGIMTARYTAVLVSRKRL